MSGARRPAGGFTLLELVLAMSALALMAAICYGAFHLAIRAVERGEIAVTTTQRLRVSSDVVIRQIKSMVPYAARNRDEDIYPYFFGGATWMTFVTGAGLNGGGGLTRVSYQVVDDPPRLVVAESPFFSPDALGREPVDQVGERATVLLEGFTSLKFEYMLSDGVDTEWRSEWNGHDEEAMPTAVRILVDGMPGFDTAQWGQEIPMMAATYGESGTELGEEDEEDLAGIEPDDYNEDEDRPPTRDWKTPRAPGDEDDEGDDE